MDSHISARCKQHNLHLAEKEAPMQVFADKLVEIVNMDEDYVWIHDYHLLVRDPPPLDSLHDAERTPKPV